MDKYYRRNERVNGSYKILKIIGEGRYGIAYLAEDNAHKKVVVKQLKTDMLKETRKKLFYEQKILKSLDHPAFPKFLGSFWDKYRQGYILEYKEGRTLYDILEHDGRIFTKEEIYSIASETVNLIDILHSNNIVHRDIRLPNVILNQNNQLSLIDFGLARFIDKRYSREMDYWYLGDFILHLLYSEYEDETSDSSEKPWFEELDLSTKEKNFIMSLLGTNDKTFNNIQEIKQQLIELRN